MERTQSVAANRPPGILEHLSDGMSLVLEAPHLMLIPVLLDLYLFLGLRISSGALTGRVGDWFLGRSGDSSHDVGAWIRDRGDWDISRLTALLTPSVIDGLPQDKIYQPFTRLDWNPSSLITAAVGILLAILGIGILSGFLIVLANRASMIRTGPTSAVSTFCGRWFKLIGFGLVLVAGIAILAGAAIIPGHFLSGGAMSAETVVGIVSLVGLPILLLTMFVPEAIVIDGAGPIKAMRASSLVVTRYFWQSIAFFAVSLMISPGLLSIWERIAGDPVGLGIAVLINALMVTSLSLASLSFYRARFDGVAQFQHPA